MILLDADVLLIDLRYSNDSRFAVNQRLLHQLKAERRSVAMTSQAILEVVGVLSFNVAPAKIAALPNLLCAQYARSVIPDPRQDSEFTGCTFHEIVSQMVKQMAAGNAVQAVQIERHAASADCLISWNAKHFAGKLVTPVLTPDGWLARHASSP